MSDETKIPDAPSKINIVMQTPEEMFAQQQVKQQKLPRKNPEEEWKLNKAAITRFASDRNWPEVLKLLTFLSTKRNNNEVYKVLAMRVWVCLKSDTPVTEVVLGLFQLLNTLSPKHEMAGHIAALANLMARNRTPDHEDRELAIGQAQQMLSMVCEFQGISGEEEFDKWIEENQFNDPNHYVPVVMDALDMMVGEDWWFDRDDLQSEMVAANEKKLETESGYS
ncbi:MAG: hypothetical protein HQL67_12645 [Magnetococcales bacterium]|nr:hypothetical protein [Magnetococcales bacterium]